MRRTRRLVAAAAVVIHVGVGVAAAADVDTLARRTAMLAVDDACSILSDGARMALRSGRDASRSALLRAGAPLDVLDEIEYQAQQRAARRACTDPDLAAAATEAESAYEAWRGMITLDYPGDQRVWRAYRVRMGVAPAWMVRQDTSVLRDARASFGILSPDQEAGAWAAPRVAFFVDGLTRSARTARLFMRDATAHPGPVDPFVAQLSGLSASDPVLVRAAPSSLATMHWAAERLNAKTTDTLAYGEKTKGGAFVFGPDALPSLLQLDPRESVYVEVDVGEDAPPLRVAFEIADLSAAFGFAALP